jgi:signal transduction histidine kinase
MLDVLGSLQFKIAAAVLTTLVLLATLNEFLRTSLSGFTATLANLGAVFVFFVLNFWYIRRQTRPLEELTATVDKLASGDLNARAEQDLKNKIGALAEAFNKMADQLTKKIGALEKDNLIKKEFISIMSHNLQTPLTIIRGYVDQLLQEKDDLSFTQSKTLKIIENTIKDLVGMNARLLTTIELQGEAIKLNKTKQDLGALAGEVVKEFKKKAEEKQIVLGLKVARESLISKFDEEWLEVVFENLLDNALKFTPEKGKVVVRVGKTSEGGIFGEVEDTGIGIPKEEQDEVLLPFRRTKDVLRADFEGVGVGLYIVKRVIKKHGGQLKLESEEGKGTKIRFTLPKPEEG